MPHWPLLQTAEPFCGTEHALVHCPQCVVDVCVSTQAPPHLVSPTLQLKSHLLATQVGTPPGGALQPLPQLPQLEGSAARSTQLPLQFVVPAGQVVVQFPPEHTWFAPQALLQAPQCELFASRFTHSEPHKLSPALQLTPHAPALQVGLPPVGAVQTLPQVPQFWTSVLVSTHWPAHGVFPPLQVKPHWAEAQVAWPPGGAEQEMPHPEQ